ncbi:1-deoxy-D-xylulose-5-phosphate reductoisomerase [Limibacillus halophilus]|uniref:1-deoxy-D-xylulose 5-phosphate reductoisomerase n=1 Tax=Limibacillus halophilus TaxID=1579333 RepID=A0A839SSU7_9PROT|nr:1-deoxy-D-xylulose-5-phosphate reductoisomerase [Limibacillus halophilus]MBB3065881.1 1-deoxy-D-xylulose-5-phosphate reductoisomerase [Limibacillus halophilus]
MTDGLPRCLTILGSTGSVGTSTLDLVSHHKDRFQIAALTANNNIELLAAQARRFKARFVVTADEARYADLKSLLSGSGIEVAAGREALLEAAKRPSDLVMAAIVGAAGLAPTLEAVRRGCIVALANKETLVCAGDIMMREVAAHGATLLPVDSEHNAIFQVLDRTQPETVERIVLTASGGPFRGFDQRGMERVTPAQAIAHPNWDMGAKISVDSATMMNKGLELIEAHHLFGMPQEQIEILVHPQSIIHSMVAYVDGSLLAQLGAPDMRIPIAYALAWPKRMQAPVSRLNLADLAQLTFEKPDPERFPALSICRDALVAGGCAPTALNAANEIAVEGFLAGRLGFLEIAKLVRQIVESFDWPTPNSVEDALLADEEARRITRDALSTALQQA